MPETIIRPVIGSSGRLTPASFPFFTSGEDNLRIVSYNSAPGVTLKVNGRTLDPAGNTKADSWDHTPNTDRSAKSTDLALSGSTLLNVTVFASGGAPLMGQTYVIVQLIRGIGSAALVLGTVLQGYVTQAQALGWPGSPLQTSIESGGYQRSITATVPAGGSEISEAVPSGARWELLSLNFNLSCQASGPTRTVRLFQINSGRITSITTPTRRQSLSENQSYSYAQNLPAQGAIQLAGGFWVTQQTLALGALFLAGDSFQTSTDQLQPGDAYTSIFYLVREWLES